VDEAVGLAQKGMRDSSKRAGKILIFSLGIRNALTQKVFEREQGFVAGPRPAW
jgi:hypothetical protein